MNLKSKICANSDYGVDDRTPLERILAPLAYQPRLDILLKLQHDACRLTTLSKHLGLQMPEVHRNIMILLEAKLIRKDAENNLSLSALGLGVVKQISSFRFISNNAEYFSSHCLGELPDRFIQSLGAFEKSNLSIGWVNVVEHWKDIIINAREYFYAITTQAGSDSTDLVFQKIKENKIKLKAILPDKPIISDKIEEIMKKHRYNELYSKGFIERRKVRSVHVGIMLNEKQAAVIFPNEKNELDFKDIFYSDDISFHEWCLEYFHYRWNTAADP